jgi:hypothetical protein
LDLRNLRPLPLNPLPILFRQLLNFQSHQLAVAAPNLDNAIPKSNIRSMEVSPRVGEVPYPQIGIRIAVTVTFMRDRLGPMHQTKHRHQNATTIFATHGSISVVP